MIHDFESLENWELRIIDTIKNDSKISLELLVKDGRNQKDLLHTGSFQFSKIGSCLNEILFEKQEQLEKKRYLKNLPSLNADKLKHYLNKIPDLKLNPHRQGDTDLFSKEESEEVKEYNLDLILKMNFKIINGAILCAAKYGVWTLIFSDNSLRRGGFPGFWEVLNKEAVVAVSLFKLNSDGNGQLIDKAYFNRNPTSAIITNNIVKESSVTLLLKNIRNLENITIRESEELVDFKFLYHKTGNFYIGKYILNFYSNYISGKVRGIFESRDNRLQCWTLFIGEGKFMETDLKSLKPVNLPKDEFWADPFLFQYKNDTYVFFENFSYSTQRGKISCGRVENENLVDITDVLNLPYHLSYPFIFQENDAIYMMPETSENNRLEIFRCKSFPDQWEIYTTAFEEEQVVDASFYLDKHNKNWLFLNKIASPNVDRTSELHIYQVDSIRLNKIIAHKQNPVIIDARVARNGGAIFKIGENIFRPSQCNIHGVYGKGLNINRITKLTLDEYEEETIQKVEANFKKDFVSIHHLHQTDEMFVFDAAYKQL